MDDKLLELIKMLEARLGIFGRPIGTILLVAGALSLLLLALDLLEFRNARTLPREVMQCRPQQIKQLTEQEIEALFAEYASVRIRRESPSLSTRKFDELDARKAYLESILEHPDLPKPS